MKKIILLLLFPLFLSACNLPVAGNQPAPEVLPVSSTVPPTSALSLATPLVPLATVPTSALATPIVPLVLIPTLTAAPLPQTHPSDVIKFAPGGTWKDVQGSVPSEGSIAYILGAAKGQVMSVSTIAQSGLGGYFPLQIQGRNGTVLCPTDVNNECYFWRGTLPLTQDYFITVKSSGDQKNFTLHVAINPPGQDVQFFQYINPATGLSLNYTDNFAPATSVPGNYKTDPELTLHLIDSKSYDKTNLSEVYLFVSSTSNAQTVATCTEPNQNSAGPEQVIGNETINGFTFVHSASEGAGAGNFYQQEIYRMANKNVCYEVVYYIHSTNIGNYTPGTVIEFDKDAVMQKLYGVFSTFTIK